MDIRACLYNACAPGEPATPAQYVDCSDARGSDTLAEEFLSKLEMANRPLHFLFTGHIGCGKSSELKCLQTKLEQGALPNGKKYLPVYLDAQEYLDEYDVEPVDLLLAIVGEMAEVLEKQAGIHLEEHYLSRKLQEVKDLLKREVDLEEAEIPAPGDVKFKLKLLRSDPTQRQKVRAALTQQTTTLHYEMNQIFLKAKVELRKKGYEDFVLILDSLDRIQKIGSVDEGTKSHVEFFIERAPQLTQIQAHIIFTVPLTLARLYAGELLMRYGQRPFVLPMIKVSERDSKTHCDIGREKLKTILQQRLTGCGEAGIMPNLYDVISEEAVALLIDSCGGHVRHLMHFTQETCASSRILPLSREAVLKGRGGFVNGISGMMRMDWWEKLARLHVSTTKELDLEDEDYVQMLDQAIILEYRNGLKPSASDDEEDIEIKHDSAWYAVHPIVQKFPQFKQAVAALNTSTSTAL